MDYGLKSQIKIVLEFYLNTDQKPVNEGVVYCLLGWPSHVPSSMPVSHLPLRTDSGLDQGTCMD